MEFKIKDDFIKLGQLIKAAGMVDNGAEAKIVIQSGKVSLNGKICTQRGRKIVAGDDISYKNEHVKVVE